MSEEDFADNVCRIQLVQLREIMVPIRRLENPLPGKIYRQLGVKLWGEGAYERESIDGCQTKYKTLSMVQEMDIVVNKIWARNGAVAVVPKDLSGCFVSGEFPVFSPVLEKLEPRWFHWLTKTKDFWRQCDEKSQGTSGKNRIRPEKFLEIEIPLPPVVEQRRIIARIEELAARIEEARELRRRAVEDTYALQRSYYSKYFLNLDGEKNKKIPLRDLVNAFGGGTPSKHNAAYWDGNIPWISPKDMTSIELYDGEDHITENAISESSTSLVPSDSILIVARSGILRRTIPIAINRVPVAINQDLKALIPCNHAMPEYIR
jgi:type I restriction enzyme, S subunit